MEGKWREEILELWDKALMYCLAQERLMVQDRALYVSD